MLLHLAWRNLWRHKRRTILTATTMAVTVAFAIALGAWTDGFVAAMRTAVVDRQIGHVQVHHPDYPTSMSPWDSVPDAAANLDKLKAIPGVATVGPRVQGFGIFAGAGDDAMTGAIQGVVPSAEAALTCLDTRVHDGTFLLDGDTTAALIGDEVAGELHLKPGDELLVVTNALDGSFGDARYKVAGIYQTGNLMLDKGVVLVMAEAQRLFGLGDAIHEVVVLTDDADDIEAVVARAQVALPSLSIRPWWEVSPETFEMQNLTAVSMGIFSFLLICLSAFLVINTLLMSVYERIHEFGILLAVGTRPRQLVAMILGESTLLALLSAGMGLALGLALALLLVDKGIPLGVGDEGYAMGGMVLDPVIYGALTPAGVLAPLLSLFFVGIVGGLWPAFRAARLDPVAALRQE